MWFWGGTSSTSPQKEVTDISPQEFYSADHLLRLLDSLPPCDAIDERNRESTIETLRQVAEVLVWGEHNNRGYFDTFCEQNVLSYFVQLAEQPNVPNTVKVQLLQTLSIIVQSINKETAVYYMFSNNYINSLLSTKFDFDDEEVASWYVSFIKSLSLLVNPDTIKLFLNERAKHFPIYSESVKFFRAKDSMVRTHSRNVTLSLFRVQDPSLRSFLLERPIFFSHVACYLRELLDGLLLRLTATRAPPPDRDRGIQDAVLEIEEMLFYIQDMFNLGIEQFSDLLAARLLVHCYLPLIGMLGIRFKSRREGDNSSSEKAGAGAHDNISPCPQPHGSGEQDRRSGTPRKSTAVDSCPQVDKSVEQGWMWGWDTPDDLQSLGLTTGISDKLGDADRDSNILPNQTVDLSKSWRARAAEAMSRRLNEGPRGKGESSACMVPEESSASVPHGATSVPESQQQNQWHSISNRDAVMRVILFFLTHTFNCIQNEKLLQPVVAALLLPRVPQPLYELIMAKAPTTPEAYRNLRNPTDCAGRIEMFLPIQEQPSSDVTSEVTTEGNNVRTDSNHSCKETREATSPREGDHEKILSDLSLEDRIRMLNISMDFLHKLNYFDNPGGIEGSLSQNQAWQLLSSQFASQDVSEPKAESRRRQANGNQIIWCHNPVQHHLVTLLDGCMLAQQQCDVSFLVLAILLESIFRHPATTTGFLMRACILPSGYPLPNRSIPEMSDSGRSKSRCSDTRTPESAASTPAEIAAPRLNSCHHQVEPLERLASPTTDSHVTTDGVSWLPASAPATHSLSIHRQPEMHGLCSAHKRKHYDKMSWCFTAQMLDAVHAQLPNTLLRPISLRTALSVISTLTTEHILKVQSWEYRARSLEVLANKMLKLRHAAAVAAKLCLSALSDGHTIDVFWDEWEVHRIGAITDWAFSRDFRILLSPPSSQTDSKASAFPPYLLVATTDQEIERRSIQVFLLLRRLHRDLSAILEAIRETPHDVTAVAQKASAILHGTSVEPNPLESEDNAGEPSHVGDLKTLGKEATPQLCLEGRNIIRCTVETSSGPATRYCVQDEKRLLLVTPSCVFPDVGDIRTSHPLRNVECRLKTNSSRCMHLLILDVVPPTDGPSQSSSSDPPEGPPTMRVSLTAPPLKEGYRMERPALWEIRLHFADALRCSTVFHALQQARGIVRRNLASRIADLLEEV